MYGFVYHSLTLIIIFITPFLSNVILWMNESWKPYQLKIPFIIYMCFVQIVMYCSTLMYKSNCDSNVYVFYGHISKEVFLLLSCWTSVKRDCILILNQLKKYVSTTIPCFKTPNHLLYSSPYCYSFRGIVLEFYFSGGKNKHSTPIQFVWISLHNVIINCATCKQ